jgi:hypothetical protein
MPNIRSLPFFNAQKRDPMIEKGKEDFADANESRKQHVKNLPIA